MMKKAVWITLVVGLWAGGVQAQTPLTNPTGASFTPSADHNVVVAGVPKVTSYRLETYVFTTVLGTLTFQKDLGKPTPNGSNVIVITGIDFSPLPQGSYEARVVAVGPSGEGASNYSAPFVKLTIPVPPGAPTLLP